MNNFLSKKVNFFGKSIPLSLVLLFGLTLISAGLLTYFGQVVTEVNVQQGVYLDGNAWNVPTSISAQVTSLGGLVSSNHKLTNDASVNANLNLVTLCSSLVNPNSCNEIDTSYWTPSVYEYSESINIVDEYNLQVTVEEDEEWMKWTFAFPVENWEGNGQLPLALIIGTNGIGEGPSYQIHNNDGTDANHSWGTWLMSPWGPTIDDGWNGWHSGSDNTLVSDLDWVEAEGEYYAQGESGILVVKIKKESLGNTFYWASYPQTGGGWYSPYKNQQMPTPSSFSWSNPIIGESNYHKAELMEELVNPFVLYAESELDFTILHNFPTGTYPGDYTLTTNVELV